MQWLIKHPQFLENNLFIGGDSYSGIPVPMLTWKIYEGNKLVNLFIFILYTIFVNYSVKYKCILCCRDFQPSSSCDESSGNELSTSNFSCIDLYPLTEFDFLYVV